ncbi:hypothetical protein ENTCAN_07857 [Enterobacter cancerogenus ATCC 35316]|nr:hypothetical protein ENTCAN_07857 [Enterobacter cancerogenus ATCC 35316]
MGFCAGTDKISDNNLHKDITERSDPTRASGRMMAFTFFIIQFLIFQPGINQ